MKAFIFDMDGVISDTQTLQAKNEEQLLKKYNINLPADKITEKYAGVSDDYFFSDVFADFGKEIDSIGLEKIIQEKSDSLFEIAQGNIKEIKGASKLIKQLYDRGCKLAVASASVKPFIDLVLEELKLTDYFLVKVSATEVANGKPAPDIFLAAAEKLGVAPEDCVVIEDGINGMQAAKKAKMKCIGLVKDKDKNYPADILVNSLAEIDLNIF